jgi:hypothetical protein
LRKICPDFFWGGAMAAGIEWDASWVQINCELDPVEAGKLL